MTRIDFLHHTQAIARNMLIVFLVLLVNITADTLT